MEYVIVRDPFHDGKLSRPLVIEIPFIASGASRVSGGLKMR
jgi:hypothetical protein